MTPIEAPKSLVAVVRAMDAEQDGEKPTEEQYQAALAQADEVIALATGNEPATQETAPWKQHSKPSASQPKSAKQTRPSTKPAAT